MAWNLGSQDNNAARFMKAGGYGCTSHQLITEYNYWHQNTLSFFERVLWWMATGLWGLKE